jgi:transcription antitermination factor NusG
VSLNPTYQDWGPIRYTPGVSYLLAQPQTENEGTEDEVTYSVPVRLAQSLIEQVRQCCILRAAEQPQLWVIHPGTLVRVSDPRSPFHKQEAICSWTDGQRAALATSLFGRPSELEFLVQQLEVA